MENKVRKAIKEEIIKLKEQLGPRMKSPRPTGPSDPRSSKDIEFDNAQAMSRLTPDDKDKINKIKQMMDKEKPLKEAGPSNNPYYNNLVIKAKEMGIHVNDLMKSLLKDKSEMEIVKMGYQDLAALAGVEDLDETDAIATARSIRPSGEKDEEQDEYDKGWYGESLKEVASKLGYLNEHYKGYKTDNTLNPWNRPEFNQDENNAYRYFNDLFFDGNFQNPNELLRDLEEFHMIEKEEAKRILSQYFNDLMKTVEKEVTDTTEKQTFKNSMIKKGFKGYLKEIDGMEGGFDHSKFDFQEKVIKAEFMYTEQGGRFYSLTLSTSDNRQIKLKHNEANAWLKDTLEYIHEDDLIPRKYISGLEDLDLIVDRLKELNIEASHNDFMDVS